MVIGSGQLFTVMVMVIVFSESQVMAMVIDWDSKTNYPSLAIIQTRKFNVKTANFLMFRQLNVLEKT